MLILVWPVKLQITINHNPGHSYEGYLTPQMCYGSFRQFTDVQRSDNWLQNHPENFTFQRDTINITWALKVITSNQLTVDLLFWYAFDLFTNQTVRRRSQRRCSIREGILGKFRKKTPVPEYLFFIKLQASGLRLY